MSKRLGLRGSLVREAPIPCATAPICGNRYCAILGPAAHASKPVKTVPSSAYIALLTSPQSTISKRINAPVNNSELT
ncbi:uncharacterized protein METZ01_LOCUS478059, partial [marine metagenome]